MNIGLVSSQYAKALLEYAIEAEQAKKVYSNIKTLYENLTENEELIKALTKPFIKNEQKRNLLMTASGTELENGFKKFIDIIIANDRIEELSYICLKFEEMYRKHFNVYKGKLITVVKWSDSKINKLKQIILQGHEGEFEFEYVVDKNIIGGFIFEINNMRLDASIVNQIRIMRRELLDRNKRIV